ncbi:MAG TPA: hypothetical protein VJY65_10890 [Chloroflexota bacterium]|nr:hypothetical protein [Chloroflexota bacterium]
MIVLLPAAREQADHNASASTHRSTRHTLEEIDGVRPRLGDAQHTTDLSAFFTTTFP